MGRIVGLCASPRIVHWIRRELAPFILSGRVFPTGDPAARANNHVSFCIRGMHRRDIVAAMTQVGVHLSGGSACHTDELMPSHALVAIGVPAAFIHGSVRITLSHTNTLSEVEDILCPALRRLLLSPSLSAGVQN